MTHEKTQKSIDIWVDWKRVIKMKNKIKILKIKHLFQTFSNKNDAKLEKSQTVNKMSQTFVWKTIKNSV